MKKSNLLKKIFVTFFSSALALNFFVSCNSQVENKNVYSSPLVWRRSEPSILKHTDQNYYLVYSYDYGSFASLKIRSADKINKFRYKSEYTINFTNASSVGAYSYFFTPELKFINGQWFLFFSASVSNSGSSAVWQQRPFVAKCDGSSPLTDSWTILGQVQAVKGEVFDSSENIISSYTLGPTVFYANGEWYFAWSQTITDGDDTWDLDGETGDNDNLTLQIGTDSSGNVITESFADLAKNSEKATWQCIFIGKTSPDDFTKVTQATVISVPEYDWECGTSQSHSDTDFGNVNYSPRFIIKGEKIFCIFSAGDMDESSCMGLLTANLSSELCSYSSWIKNSSSIFETSSDFNAYGPGSFSLTSDDDSDVMLYSARYYNGLYSSGTTTTTNSYKDLNRALYAKQISWNADGTPNLRF